MGSKLQLASRTTTTRYEEDGDFMVCRSELTRGEMSKLMRLFPQERADGTRDMEQAAAFMEEFFVLVTLDWSLEDEDGSKIPVSVEAYRNLTIGAGMWVDGNLNKHMPVIMGTTEGDEVGESTS